MCGFFLAVFSVFWNRYTQYVPKRKEREKRGVFDSENQIDWFKNKIYDLWNCNIFHFLFQATPLTVSSVLVSSIRMYMLWRHACYKCHWTVAFIYQKTIMHAVCAHSMPIASAQMNFCSLILWYYSKIAMYCCFILSCSYFLTSI